MFLYGPEKGRMMISTISKIDAWAAHLAESLSVGLERATWHSEPTLRNRLGRCKLRDLDQFTSVTSPGDGGIWLTRRIVPR